MTPDPTPLCAGYLYKLGGARHSPGASGVSRTWHRRWFALKKDHCLYYYKSETVSGESVKFTKEGSVLVLVTAVS